MHTLQQFLNKYKVFELHPALLFASVQVQGQNVTKQKMLEHDYNDFLFDRLCINSFPVPLG